MNELIEELETKWAKCEITLAQAIQAACKAQAKACARVYEDYGDANEIGYNKSKIKTAQIERQDYE